MRRMRNTDCVTSGETLLRDSLALLPYPARRRSGSQLVNVDTKRKWGFSIVAHTIIAAFS